VLGLHKMSSTLGPAAVQPPQDLMKGFDLLENPRLTCRAWSRATCDVAVKPSFELGNRQVWCSDSDSLGHSAALPDWTCLMLGAFAHVALPEEHPDEGGGCGASAAAARGISLGPVLREGVIDVSTYSCSQCDSEAGCANALRWPCKCSAERPKSGAYCS
jgi:hypothetical protein